MGKLLNVEDLKVSFDALLKPVKAVQGVSFFMEEGEIFALVGESGCGKSTTAQSILGLYDIKKTSISAKELKISEFDILYANNEQMKEIRRNVCSMVFQDPMNSLNPSMKVGRQIEEVLKYNGLKGRQRREEVIRLLKFMQIPEPKLRANQYPTELSGGMCQRVMIAMALASNPKLLIADEPTVSLDVTVQLSILKLLLKINRESNMAILLISHDLSVVANIANRVGVMYGGRIVEQGSVEDIFNNPKHPYTKTLLLSVPMYNKGEELRVIGGSPPKLYEQIEYCSFCDRCNFKKDICTREYPKKYNINEKHEVFCWLLEDER